MYWLNNAIGRPEQAHGVRTEEEYRQRAMEFLARHGRLPVLKERDGDQPPAYVSEGRWVCDCDCGNGPSASPEWGIAICFECGSIWRPIIPADHAEGEEALLQRPLPRYRHWFPDDVIARQRGRTRAETVNDLRRENREHLEVK